MKYKLNTRNKKDLVMRIEELTGTKARYTRTPRFSYDFEGMSVNRQGDLEVTDFERNRSVITEILAEGLIRSWNGEAAEEEVTGDGDAVPDDEAAPVDTEAVREEADRPETPEQGSAGNGENREETQQAFGRTSREVIEQVEKDFNPDLVKPEIAFRLDEHTGQSLENLVSLIYSRGRLISKATGGLFYASEDLVDRMMGSPEYPTVESMTELIRDAMGVELKGVRIDGDKLVFSGFPASDDEEMIQAFVHLATLMNRQTMEQSVIHAKKSDDSNERYSSRTWLLRIGMNGHEYKKTRSILMKRLDGHTAYRIPAQARRWSARQAAKKEKMKAERTLQEV